MTATRGATAISVAVVVLALATLLWFRVSYDRAVSRCADEGPDSVTAASHGWHLNPPGFWCEQRHEDGRTTRTEYGLVP
jgi:hypothetical protein